METALVRSPAPTYSAITPETKAPERTEPSATTDLATSKTVLPANDSNGSSRAADNSRTQEPVTAQPQIERQNFIDPESESFVYVAKDRDTGEVLQQIPSESLRRVRAYNKSLTEQNIQENAQKVSATA